MTTCAGINKNGKRCKARAAQGKKYCARHGVKTRTSNNARGRPTKYSSELAEEIFTYILIGMPLYRACEAVGIGRRTLYDWVTRGEAGEEPYAEFLAIFRTREALQIRTSLSLFWQRATARDILSFLARRYPEDWSELLTVKMVETEAELESEYGPNWLSAVAAIEAGDDDKS